MRGAKNIIISQRMHMRGTTKGEITTARLALTSLAPTEHPNSLIEPFFVFWLLSAVVLAGLRWAPSRLLQILGMRVPGKVYVGTRMDRRTQQPNIQHLILHDFSCVASQMDDPPARYYKVMITKCCTRRMF
jgi:hypothetical protein